MVTIKKKKKQIKKGLVPKERDDHDRHEPFSWCTNKNKVLNLEQTRYLVQDEGWWVFGVGHESSQEDRDRDLVGKLIHGNR